MITRQSYITFAALAECSNKKDSGKAPKCCPVPQQWELPHTFPLWLEIPLLRTSILGQRLADDFSNGYASARF